MLFLFNEDEELKATSHQKKVSVDKNAKHGSCAHSCSYHPNEMWKYESQTPSGLHK